MQGALRHRVPLGAPRRRASGLLGRTAKAAKARLRSRPGSRSSTRSRSRTCRRNPRPRSARSGRRPAPVNPAREPARASTPATLRDERRVDAAGARQARLRASAASPPPAHLACRARRRSPPDAARAPAFRRLRHARRGPSASIRAGAIFAVHVQQAQPARVRVDTLQRARERLEVAQVVLHGRSVHRGRRAGWGCSATPRARVRGRAPVSRNASTSSRLARQPRLHVGAVRVERELHEVRGEATARSRRLRMARAAARGSFVQNARQSTAPCAERHPAHQRCGRTGLRTSAYPASQPVHASSPMKNRGTSVRRDALTITRSLLPPSKQAVTTSPSLPSPSFSRFPFPLKYSIHSFVFQAIPRRHARCIHGRDGRQRLASLLRTHAFKARRHREGLSCKAWDGFCAGGKAGQKV